MGERRVLRGPAGSIAIQTDGKCYLSGGDTEPMYSVGWSSGKDQARPADGDIESEWPIHVGHTYPQHYLLNSGWVDLHPAVSDAVASARLSGVNLPADWVDTLGKVARGEVTADDAVKAVVDSDLRDRIARAIAAEDLCAPARARREPDYDGPTARAAAVMAEIGPLLVTKAHADIFHNRGVLRERNVLRIQVAELSEDAMQLDIEMAQLRRDLESAVATREQYVEERDGAIRLLKICTGLGDEPSHAQRIQSLTAEVERLRKSNALIDRLHAELDAVKAKADNDRPWNEAIDWLLNSRHTADPDIQSAFWGMVEGRFTREQADNGVFEYDAEGNASIPTEDEQPDTGATEQAPREPRVVRKKKDCFHPWPGCNCPVVEVVEDGES